MANYAIKSTNARQILDSRGNPTVSVTITTANSASGTALVPSGASTGTHEAVELRDGGKAYGGKGVSKAVSNVNKPIAKAIAGLDCRNQRKLDNTLIELDGTPNKARLGANAILGASLAACRAAALATNTPLHQTINKLTKQPQKQTIPVPYCNIINGGKHAGSGIDFQEFMLVPNKAKTYHDALRSVSETYHELKTILEKKCGKHATGVGDEGGFAPPLSSREPLEVMQQAVDAAGHTKTMAFALDVAASSFYHDGKYFVEGKPRSAEWLLDFYEDLAKTHPLVSIEDPFFEDDWPAFTRITKELGNKIQIVGDDLLVTNPLRIKRAIQEKACNALLLKVNQIGTLSEALDATELARKNKFNTMVSHRSGETEDSFIADLAVGLGCGQIKAGAPCRSERTAKYNRLLELEETVRTYAGG